MFTVLVQRKTGTHCVLQDNKRAAVNEVFGSLPAGAVRYPCTGTTALVFGSVTA